MVMVGRQMGGRGAKHRSSDPFADGANFKRNYSSRRIPADKRISNAPARERFVDCRRRGCAAGTSISERNGFRSRTEGHGAFRWRRPRKRNAVFRHLGVSRINRMACHFTQLGRDFYRKRGLGGLRTSACAKNRSSAINGRAEVPRNAGFCHQR